MKNRITSLGIVALALTASSVAYAGHVSVEINPFGFWGPPPPVVYVAPRYSAPPAVYYGRGHYGDRHDYSHRRDDRGHDRRR
jgi:hypothetical protein